MTDQDPSEEQIGSVAEEAAKLFGAFADVARQHGADAAGGVTGLAGQAAAFTRELNDHLATEDPECRYCPVCRAVHVVRQTSPEVRQHLVTAASSLLQAAAGLLETIPPAGDREEPSPRGGVEKIDLDGGPAATGDHDATAPGGSGADEDETW